MIPRRQFLVSGAAAVLAACGREKGGRILRATDAHPDGYPTVEAVRFMGKDLDRRSNGRLTVHMYSGGQLGEEKDTLEITVFGGLDLNRVSLAPLSNISPLVIVPSLPFLFSSQEHMRAAMDGAPGQRILDSLQPFGLVGLCFYDSGARSVYNNLRPVVTPDDMRGMKIRVQNSDVFVAMMTALGANPTPMPYGEVYQALVQGVVDVAENNWPSLESSRHYEAIKYYSLTRHVMVPEILLMSLHSWNRLDDEERGWVRAAARASVPVMRQIWDERVAASRERVLAAGTVTVNEEVDTPAFQARLEPVWDRFLVTPELRQLADDIRAMDPGGG
jgi:tripartite ATP-independent transporter DctP family solute receptor